MWAKVRFFGESRDSFLVFLSILVFSDSMFRGYPRCLSVRLSNAPANWSPRMAAMWRLSTSTEMYHERLNQGRRSRGRPMWWRALLMGGRCFFR